MTRKTDGLLELESVFAERIATMTLGKSFRFEQTVSSTNDVARQWAVEGIGPSARTGASTSTSTSASANTSARSPAPHGALVFAEYQTHGRGRQGRGWKSTSGLNLTFSLVLRPELPISRYPILTLAAGMSVYSTIQRRNPALSVSIKWPNDILVSQAKCAGLLLESSIGPVPEDNIVVLGIGINVNQMSFDADIEGTATSLLLETGQLQDRIGILVEVLAELETQIKAVSEDPAGFVNRYESVMEGIGKSVQLNTFTSDSDSVFSGTISGITEDGALRLETGSGERIFYAGEVTFNKDQTP